MVLTETDVKKQLYKSKEQAVFSHYVSGNLYYTIVLDDGIYQFPMPTTEERKFKLVEETSEGDVVLHTFTSKKLSNDLGTTPFYREMKGSELNRWIAMAIKNGEFIKIQ